MASMKSIRPWFLWATILLASPTAMAQSTVPNGDFEDDLNYWTPHGDVTAVDLSGNGVALLAEAGAGSLSQIYQDFQLPSGSSPSHLYFRYRFEYTATPGRPVLTAAVSRKTHGGVPALGDVDIDVMAGKSESRSATIDQATTDLLIIATFNKPIALLDLGGDEVTTDEGTIGTLVVSGRTLEVPITGVGHATQVNVAFPGVVDVSAPRSETASESTLCIGVVTGDYNNDGQATNDDTSDIYIDGISDTETTVHSARADYNLDGSIDAVDIADVADLISAGAPAVVCTPQGIASPEITPTMDPTLPPDSFLMFLADPSTDGRLVGSVPDLAADANFPEPVFYVDSNGEMFYDNTVVTINEQPDVEGFSVVTIDISTLSASQDVRAAFALNSVRNAANTWVMVDDLTTDCPPGYCCAADGTPTEIDDGDPCTADDCTDGVPTHTEACPEECHQCTESAGNVVIMLDRTGSTHDDDLIEEKLVARNFLDFYSGSAVRPLVAIGTFNGPCSGCGSNTARLVSTGLTDQYGTYDPSDPGNPSTATGLYKTINEITNGPSDGYTDIGNAITVAADGLPDRAPEAGDSPNYIIIISDGWVNVDENEHKCGNVCDCAEAQQWVRDAADAAEDDPKNATIVGVHYIGHRGNLCPNDIQVGVDVIANDVATTSDYFFEGTDLQSPGYQSQLECTFYDVVQVISCDDDDPATRDCCREGKCLHGSICE